MNPRIFIALEISEEIKRKIPVFISEVTGFNVSKDFGVEPMIVREDGKLYFAGAIVSGNIESPDKTESDKWFKKNLEFLKEF